MDQKTTAGPRISVIIPVFNETTIINGVVRHVRDVAEGPVEIVVADGGPGTGRLPLLRTRLSYGWKACPDGGYR